MQIAILGGSFDPPHAGHWYVAEKIKETCLVDQVWLMPCFKHPFNKNISSASHRLAMTKLVENEWLKVSDFEITQNNTSYSIDTLSGLTKKYPEHSFFWIIGSDQIEDFPKWKMWKMIISDYGLVIFPRGTNTTNLSEKVKSSFKLSHLPNTIYIIDHKEIVPSSASSTDIRKRLKNNQSITHLVSKEVQAYIIKQKLYL